MSFFTRLRSVWALLLVLVGFTVVAQPTPTWEWLTPMRANQAVSARRITIDAVGNSYVAGEFAGQAAFGTTTLTSRGWRDTFVAKYDARGTCLWVRQVGPAVPNPAQFGPWTQAQGIAVDSQGNAYVTGHCKGSTLFDNVEITTPNDRYERMFLAKYSSQGTVLWAKSYDLGWPGGVATDTDGTVYMAHGASPNGTPASSLVSKLDGQGNMVWTRGIHGLGRGGGSGTGGEVKVGPNHEVYIHGNCSYGASIDAAAQGSVQLSNAGLVVGSNGVFLAQYTATGTLNWVRAGYSPGARSFDFGLAIDGAGNAFITGYTTSGRMIFGNLVLTARGDYDTYVVKYDAQGGVVWGQQEGSPRVDTGRDIAVDEEGNAYLLGSFYGGQSFYSGVTLNGGSQYNNMALIKYDPQGRAIWGITQQGGGDLSAWTLAANRNGDVYILGDVWSTAVQLGSFSMSISGGASPAHVESLMAKLKSKLPLITPGGGMAPPVAEILIPNIITPNGDGQNDQFKTLGLEAEAWSCSVYNRWGVKVFDAPTYRQDWQAEGLGDGMYYYVLANRAGDMKKGWVEVRR